MLRSPAFEPPPGHVRFPLADSMRGIAVLLVIFCHSAGFSGAFATASWGWTSLYLGFAGVATFFALSGFLLYRPFVAGHAGIRRAPQIRSYGRRRVLRIVPGYWAALTLLALWPGVPDVFTGHWWVYYGFAQVYSLHTIGKGIPLAWTVCTEVTFYLALPLIAAGAASLVRRFRSAGWWRVELTIVLLFGVVGLIAVALVQSRALPVWSANTLLTRTPWFAAGMALAIASVAIEQRGGLSPRIRAVVGHAWISWGIAAGALVLAYESFDIFHLHQLRAGSTVKVAPPTVVANELLFALAGGFAILPAVMGKGGAIRRLLSWRWLAFVGLVSYGMYLWHHPLESWLADYHGANFPTSPGLGIQHLVGAYPTLTLMVSTVVLSMVAATASYYLVELPFLRRKELPLFFVRRRAVRQPGLASARRSPSEVDQVTGS